MTYRTEKWEKRIETLGDPAENAFLEWAENTWFPVVRYGLNRPPLEMRLIPTKIRYTPDYLSNFGLIEVQGCGRDGLFKFKHEKLEALQSWSNDCPVSLWLYDQPADRGHMVMLDHVVNMCLNVDGTGFRKDGMFDGYKPYSQLDVETVCWIVNRTQDE